LIAQRSSPGTRRIAVAWTENQGKSKIMARSLQSLSSRLLAENVPIAAAPVQVMDFSGAD